MIEKAVPEPVKESDIEVVLEPEVVEPVAVVAETPAVASAPAEEVVRIFHSF